MATSNPSSVRVLTRPPIPTSSSPAQTPFPPPIRGIDPSSSSPSPSLPSSSDGVVVIGFISRRPDDSAQLINRVMDSNVFGSGNLDRILNIEKEEVRDWFNWRRISYFHDEEKGFLFLQFSSTRCPAMEGFMDTGSCFDSGIEEQEFGDLQGMLFMFSVCHVIIFIQEGTRFDTQILKKFRVLQSSKHALTPFVRSQATPPLPSRPHSSSSSRPTASATTSTNSSPGRTGGIMTRNASSISLRSGLGSYTSLFPGQCTPVILFVFIDDFLDVSSKSSYVEDSADATSLNHPSSLGGLVRPNLPVKGSGSVVVLARPLNKSEGGLRRKLQSSLETQIRFLIKRSRSLTSSETSHAAGRSGNSSSSSPLFSLDSSRAVVLVDRSTSRTAESLEFATSLVEDILNGKATSDFLLLESHGQIASKEDVISVKEFIYRQSDILRGRGGMVGNANSGSAAGVGMVAVAAAAAAASVASGKSFTTPELPNLDIWLSSSQLILHGILSAKGECIDELETSKRKPHPRHTISATAEGGASKGAEPFCVAASWLESGKGMNTKFSTSWCKRALPDAKEVYLKDLPTCYPTALHEAHLERALRFFRSTVKGPAVQDFAKKLEEECISIWESGRQLCDAISLTGKPCMHQRHETETKISLLGTMVTSHSSGYVFLHACACGRSRQLRPDPFDFESANVSFNCFSDCDKLLPMLKLPKISKEGPIRESSWSLIRIGGAKYYEPSKGLLQSGFSATQKFLLKWKITIGRRKNPNGLTVNVPQQGSLIDPTVDVDADIKSAGAVKLYSGDLQIGLEKQENPSGNIKSNDKKSSIFRGPPNFTVRKPFSEVVAGSATSDSGFPPLQQRKQPTSGPEKCLKQNNVTNRRFERVSGTVDHPEQQNSRKVSSLPQTSNEISANGGTDGDSFLRIGSNVVPVNVNGSENIKKTPSWKHVITYVGFEHECPYGHRFLLNSEHLNELGSSYSLPEESRISSAETRDSRLTDPTKFGKNSRHGKVYRNSNGMITSGMTKDRNMDKLKEIIATNQTTFSISTLSNSGKDVEGVLNSISINDGGNALSMLNRNLPIYINCPLCRLAKNKKDPPKIKFAGTISQLQRIFVVTPPFPVVLAAYPVIQFEESCLPPTFPYRQQKLQFTLGSQVVLPPESFLTLRLPFVYGVQLEDGNFLPLNSFEHRPEKTASIIAGTALQGRLYFMDYHFAFGDYEMESSKRQSEDVQVYNRDVSLDGVGYLLESTPFVHCESFQDAYEAGAMAQYLGAVHDN